MGKKIIFVLLLLLAGTTLLLIYEHRRGRGEAMEHAMMELTRLYRKSIRFGADLSGVKRATGLILNAQSALDAGDEGSALRFMNEAIDVLRGLRATYDREWSILISTKKPSNNLYSGWWLEGPIYEVNIDLYPNRKFSEVTRDIPRLKELGIKTIYLMPVWYGIGYGIWDYFRLNPEYGSPSDLKELVDTAHKNGIRVLFDLVICQTPFFSYIYEEHPEWLIHTEDTSILKQSGIKVTDQYMILRGKFIFYQGELAGQILKDGRVILRHYPHLEWGWAINMTNEEVIEYFVSVATYYIREYDIDGWRVDAPQNNYNPLIVKGDHSALRLLRKIKEAITNLKPHSILFTEWDGPLSERSHFQGEQSEPLFDEVAEISYDWPFSGWLRNFEFWNGFLAKVIRNQITSHDLVEFFTSQRILYNRSRVRFFNNHDTDRVQTAFPQFHRNLLVLISTAPGIPMIYVGDEIGTFRLNEINWERPDEEMEEFYRRIFRIRENSLPLKFGSIHDVWAGGDNAYAYLRSYQGDNVVIVLNFQGRPISVTLSLPVELMRIDEASDYELIDALSGDTRLLKGSELRSFRVQLDGNSALILLIMKGSK